MKVDEVLKQCKVEGNVVKLPNINLERNDYLTVKKHLELIGGKWKGGKVQGFEFKTDPTTLLNRIKEGESVNLKKDFQFFATPKDLIDLMMDYANIQKHDSVLEPSAGQGAIVKAINEEGVTPFIFELMDTNVQILKDSNLSFQLMGKDFISEAKSGQYTKIIANPPFSKNQDIDHIMKMYDLLSRGGTLVSVSSESWVQGSQNKQKRFREFLSKVSACIFVIERGTFKESGTMVGGRLIVIKKPLFCETCNTNCNGC